MPELEPITREEKFLNGEVGMTPITREEKILAGEDVETITRREYFLKKYRGGGGGDITVEEITITENGTTTAPSGKAYSPIHTNVPLPQNAYLLKSVANLPQAIASFSDGEDMVMPSLKVAIEPQQDLHGYDSPWVGGAGKNKANPDLLLNGYTNPSNRKYDDTTMAKTQFVKTEGLSTITISATNGNRCYVCYYNDFPNVGDEALTNVTQVATSLPQTITVDSSYTYVAIQVCYNPSGANVSNVQVESGNQATAYAPYSNICPISGHTEANVVVSPTTDAEDGTTYNIQFKDGDNPLTVYGGSLDVISGELVVDRAHVDLGSLNWALENGIFRLNESIGAKLTADTSAVANMLCSVYKTVSQNAMGSTTTNQCIAGLNWSNGVRVKDSNYTDVASFKTAVSGVQLVYELATPITYQLTPTQVKSLLGSNNVWADTGNIKDAEYFSKEV